MNDFPGRYGAETGVRVSVQCKCGWMIKSLRRLMLLNVRMIEKLPPCGVNSSAVAESWTGDVIISNSAGSLGDQWMI